MASAKNIQAQEIKIYASNRYSLTEAQNSSLEAVRVSEEDLKSGKYVYEFFRAKTCRFFADIDVKFFDNRSQTPLTHAQWKALRDVGIQAFSELRWKGYVATDGSYEDGEKRKVSFHLIKPREDFCRVSFTWKKGKYSQLKFDEIFEDMPTAVKTEDGEWLYPKKMFADNLDDAVYGNKTCFRLPYGTEQNKPYPHMPITPGATIEDYFLQKESLSLCFEAKEDNRLWEIEQAKLKQQKEFEEIMKHCKPEENEDKVEVDEEYQNELLDLLAMVKKQRFVDTPAWWKLLSVIKGNGLPLKLFLEISKESGYAAYSEDSCSKAWYNFEVDPARTCRKATVRKWLQDDGVDVKSMMSKQGIISDIVSAIRVNGTLNDISVAEIFFKYYSESLYFTPMGWLHYNEIRGWELGKDEDIVYPLMKLIGTTLQQYVSKLKPRPEEDPAKFDKFRLLLLKESNAVSTYRKCLPIVKTARTLFKNDAILNEFDTKPHFFCFSDFQAIDMKTGDIIRLTKEHKIITTCGYKLPERIEEYVSKAEKFVRELIEPRLLDDEKEQSLEKRKLLDNEFESFMSMLSANFSGDPIKNNKIYIHTGVGGNGKSLLMMLLQAALGNYGSVLAIEQLTKDDKGRSDANGALANMRGKRYAQFNEADEDKATTLKIARIKELTGDQKIQVRKLFGEPFDLPITFSLNILCNDKPRLSKADGGIARRLAVFPYKMRFVEEPEADDPYQKQKNNTLMTTLPSSEEYRNGLLYLCLDHWRKNSGIFKPCASVNEANQEYLKDNNPLVEWFELYEESETPYRIKALLEDYKSYSKTSPASSNFHNWLQQLGAKIVQDSSNGHKVFVKLKRQIEEKQDFSKPQK